MFSTMKHEGELKWENIAMMSSGLPDECLQPGVLREQFRRADVPTGRVWRWFHHTRCPI